MPETNDEGVQPEGSPEAASPTPREATPFNDVVSGDHSADTRHAVDSEHAADTEVFAPITSGDTAVMEPVPGAEPLADTEPFADAEPVADVVPDAEPVDTDDPNSVAEPIHAPPTSRRNALGAWSVVTGALLLFPIALVLGHLGLRANKDGDANNRPVALAGVILGYVGLVAALAWAAIALFVVWPNVDAQNNDNASKADVINVGNSLVAQSSSGLEFPVTVEQLGSGLAVGDDVIDMEFKGEPSVTVTGDSSYNWCVNYAYEGGDQSDVSYSSTGGLMETAHCGQ